MAVSGKRMTAEDLWQLPDDGMRHELIYGELRTMAPAGSEHGHVASNLHGSLFLHLQTQPLGACSPPRPASC